MEKKEYIRPVSVSIELNATEMCAESMLNASSIEVEADDARANDRGSFDDLDDAFNF